MAKAPTTVITEKFSDDFDLINALLVSWKDEAIFLQGLFA